MKKTHLRRGVAHVAIVTSTLAFGATANAQDAEQESSQPEAEDRVIVVTGQKIERNLQEVPASVAVLNVEALEEQNIIDLNDVIDRVANITGTAGSFNIRGINSNNVSGAGQSELATIYVDGSPLPNEANSPNGPFGVWDLEQVEIFRGPQSTLQGRNALAGAIILNTANPTPYLTGRARAVLGNELDERRIAGALGGPLIGEDLMFRGAFEFYRTDGIVESPNIQGNNDRTSGGFGRLKLLYEPSWAPDLSVLLNYTHDERISGLDLSALEVEDAFDNRIIFNNRRTVNRTNTDIAVLTVEYDFTDELSLTSITSRNEVQLRSESDGDRSAEDLNFAENRFQTNTTSQELRLNYDGDRLKGVIGGYYADVNTPERVSVGNVSLNPANLFNIVGLLSAPPAFGGFGLPVPTAQFVNDQYDRPFTTRAELDNPVAIESYAIFGDFSYEVTDQLSIFGGFRYDRESQAISTGNTIELITPLPDPAGFGPLAPVFAGLNTIFEAQVVDANQEPASTSSPTFSAFLPKGGIGYKFTDDVSLNFVVQRGYRSGGVGINIAQASSFVFDQEFTWNYEASLRSQWFDNRLTLNANVYYIDWTDQQVSVQLDQDNDFDVETQNAGASRLYGFEIETEFELTPTLDIYASVGFADTEFTEFEALVDDPTGPGEILIDLSGTAFGGSERWTAAGGATWRADNGILININGNYQSRNFLSPQNQILGTPNLLDGRFLANFRGGWENDNFGIFLTVNNIFDKEVIEGISTRQDPNNPTGPRIPDFATFGDPRIIAIQLEASF
ncbi:MAG: TonB-dependent receptor [Pseudomonadota bacterium]